MDTPTKTAKDIKGDPELYDPRRKREIIKTILIVFLAVLLVLTFFSNTIMNKSLAEISTERADYGKLTERLRGSGLVESNQSYEVKVDGNKTVDTIMVKTGREVKKGDVLFTVGSEENEALTQAESELAALELDYQKAMLAEPADSSEEDQAVQNARSELAAAITKRDNAAAAQSSIQSAKEAYNYNKSQSNYYTKLQTKLQSVIMAIDTDEYSGAPAEYTGDIIQLKHTSDNAAKSYDAALTFYTTLISGEAAVPEEDIAAAKADMEAKSSAKDEAQAAYDTAKFQLRADIAAQLSDAEENADWYAAKVSEYETGSSEMGMSLDELNADVQLKQRTLEEQLAALRKSQKTSDNQNKIAGLDLEAKKKEVEKAQKKVDKLKKESDTAEVISKYSGVVSSINIKPGDTTVPDMPALVIDLADEGYTMQITVDADKTKKIKKGVEAEVINNWNGDVQAILTDIKNEPNSGSKKRILTFAVTGAVDSGSFLDLSIPCGSGSYDAIVPKSAVHHDNDGDFVLTVASKSSPLGNRYYADRVNVEVLASDERSSAVSGDIYSGDYVITAASKPVEPHDQVRMKDK